jgi:hypothetical protein
MNPAFPAKEPYPGELRSCGEPDEAPLIPCSPEGRVFPNRRSPGQAKTVALRATVLPR